VVNAHFDEQRQVARILLQPNRSWTWRKNLYLLGSLLGVLLFVGLVMAVQGLWPILPLSLLQLGLIAVAFYICIRRVYRQEVIYLSPDQVKVERGHRRVEQQHTFNRFYARVEVEKPTHRWRDWRISLRSKDVRIEIGSFLNQKDKEELVRVLRDIIARLNEARPLPA
jgi:uncharacterized membrane protein